MSIDFYCEKGPLLRNVKPVGFVFELEAPHHMMGNLLFVSDSSFLQYYYGAPGDESATLWRT